MIYLKAVEKQWSLQGHVITARFANGAVVEIPVGKSRPGAFCLLRCGEHEWYIAPVKYPGNKKESFDGGGQFYDFIHISGGSVETHEKLAAL